eukprot:SAG31_NODE_8727_length_1398_cov_3.134719_1_plen_270_part_00
MVNGSPLSSPQMARRAAADGASAEAWSPLPLATGDHRVVYDPVRGTYVAVEHALHLRPSPPAVQGGGEGGPPRLPKRTQLSTPYETTDVDSASQRDTAIIRRHIQALRPGRSPNSQAEAAACLAQMCASSHSSHERTAARAGDLRVVAAKEGAIPLLTAVLTNPDQQAAASAAWALAVLAYGNHQNRTVIVDAGAVPWLVALLTSAQPRAVEEAAYAIKILCWQHDASKIAVRKCDGLNRLIQCTHSHRSEHIVLHILGWHIYILVNIS